MRNKPITRPADVLSVLFVSVQLVAIAAASVSFLLLGQIALAALSAAALGFVSCLFVLEFKSYQP